MNEPIKELAKQTITRFDQDMDGSMVPEELGQWVLADDLQKFAELIVRECIGVGDNYQEILGNEPECFNCRKVAYGIVDKIKQHFGV